MNINRIAVLVAALLITIGVGIFFYTSQEQESENKVAATIFPIYDITRNIAGDNYDVELILPSGSSPHTYEPTVGDVNRVSGSKTIFAVGQGLDDWAADLVEGAAVYDLSKDVDLLEGGHGHDHEHEEEHEDEHGHEDEHEEEHEHEGDYDPHYWLSVHNAEKIAEAIANKMIEIDPDNEQSYINNLETYKLELEQLEERSLSRISELDDSKKRIVTIHDAFGYFAQDFDLEVVATIEPFPGKEPTVAYLSEVGEAIEESNVDKIYKEPQLSESVVNAIADDYEVEIGTLDPLGGVEGRESYIELIEYNIGAIVE